jgi:hypothetical protein
MQDNSNRETLLRSIETWRAAVERAESLESDLLDRTRRSLSEGTPGPTAEEWERVRTLRKEAHTLCAQVMHELVEVVPPLTSAPARSGPFSDSTQVDRLA